MLSVIWGSVQSSHLSFQVPDFELKYIGKKCQSEVSDSWISSFKFSCLKFQVEIFKFEVSGLRLQALGFYFHYFGFGFHSQLMIQT